MDNRISAIVAVTSDGVIGLNGKLPWHYPEDLKRFKRLTLGSTIIMGRITWESIGSKVLPGRRNIVITRQHLEGVDCYPSIAQALANCKKPIWFIGGAGIYAEALHYCDVIDVTYVSDLIDDDNAVRFPEINPKEWQAGPIAISETDSRLSHRVYTRKEGRLMQVKANNANIEYTLSGKADAPTVVLSHSLGCNRYMWDPQLEMLEQNFRVLAFDTRGHGNSEVTDGAYSMDQLADDVIGLVDVLGIEQFHWVGLSMGGMIGQSLGIRYPQRINKLVLCDTLTKQPEGALPVWAERIETAKQRGMEPLAQPTMERWFTANYRDNSPSAVNFIRKQFLATKPSGFISCCQAIMNINYLDRLAEIELPTLVIVGESDGATPVSASQVIHENIKGSQLEIIPVAAHLSNMEQPEVFNRILGDFLSS